MAELTLFDHFTLHATDEYCGVICSLPMLCLSSAILHGGWVTARSWLNLRVEESAQPAPPTETVLQHAQALDWPGPVVGMMTAASMDSCRMRFTSRDGVHVLCVATTGITNARRAGDPADAGHFDAPDWAPGTINIALFTNAALTPAAMVEALQIMTEAKTAACHDNDLESPVSGLIATGTGTDSAAVFSDPAGPALPFCGKHVLMGEWIGSLTYDVVAQGIQACRRAAASA